MSRPAYAEIDIAALKHNLSLVRKHAPQSKIISVVKANAYGHGAVNVAKALDADTDMMTVSCIEEAAALRKFGIKADILLLEGVFEAQELAECVRLKLDLVVHNSEQVEQLSNCKIDQTFNVWLKVDTGMHRLGILPEETQFFYKKLQNCSCVSTIRLMTHFSSADLLEHPINSIQIQRFSEQLREFERADIIVESSMANSAGILAWPQSHYDWVRPGIMLYGISPFAFQHEHAKALQAVMTLKSKVIAVREIAEGEIVGYGATWKANKPSRIATIAIGYGDGYPRNAKSGTPVLVNGQRAKLAGRVSMDLIGVDITDLDKVCVGDEVELWGKQLSVNEVANWADTIGYELVTRMPARVPRIYKNS